MWRCIYIFIRFLKTAETLQVKGLAQNPFISSSTGLSEKINFSIFVFIQQINKLLASKSNFRISLQPECKNPDILNWDDVIKHNLVIRNRVTKNLWEKSFLLIVLSNACFKYGIIKAFALFLFLFVDFQSLKKILLIWEAKFLNICTT